MQQDPEIKIPDCISSIGNILGLDDKFKVTVWNLGLALEKMLYSSPACIEQDQEKKGK